MEGCDEQIFPEVSGPIFGGLFHFVPISIYTHHKGGGAHTDALANADPHAHAGQVQPQYREFRQTKQHDENPQLGARWGWWTRS
jgi:hypothetical protein